MPSDSDSSQRVANEHAATDGSAAVMHQSVEHQLTDSRATSKSIDSPKAVSHAVSVEPRGVITESAEFGGSRAASTREGKRWWLLAAASALLLTALTAAGVYLVTKKPSTVDQLVILTVPSGAEIKL